MATVSQPVAAIASTANASTYAFSSFTPVAGTILVVLAGVSGSVQNPGAMVNTSGTALVWNTIALTNRLFFTASADAIFAHWAIVPAGPAASVYTVDVTGDNGTGCVALMFAIAGADTNSINPIRQFASTVRTTTATNPTTTFAQNCLTTSAIVAAQFGQLGANTSTAPTNYTETSDVAYTTPAGSGSGAYRASGETGTTLTFTTATTIWACVALEVHDANLGPQDSAYRGGSYYGYN